MINKISGIYLLYFSNTELVYVGQSVDIEKRYKEHIRLLTSGKHTKKLLDAYKSFGLPEVNILCKCSKEVLDVYENIYIKYYDSYTQGLNSLETAEEMPKPNNVGINHGMSKYSKEQILEVLTLLIQEPSIKFKIISETTGVSYQTIGNIAALDEHTWLKDELPDEYSKLATLKGTRKLGREVNTAGSKGITYPSVMSPSGVIHNNITNVSKFMRENNISSRRFYDLLNGKETKIMGWTRYDPI